MASVASSILFCTSATYFETEDHLLLQCNNVHETQVDNILFVLLQPPMFLYFLPVKCVLVTV